MFPNQLIFSDVREAGKKWRNIQEGNGGTYGKEKEEHTGRKRRSTRERNLGTCRKEIANMSANMQEGMEEHKEGKT